MSRPLPVENDATPLIKHGIIQDNLTSSVPPPKNPSMLPPIIRDDFAIPDTPRLSSETLSYNSMPSISSKGFPSIRS